MNAKQRMKKRRDRYVVGYLGAKNPVWGVDRRPSPDVTHEVTDPMTLRQAERALQKLPSKGGVIFELVPVSQETDQ